MDRQERMDTYGAVDTGAWPNHDLAAKAVLNPDSLTFEEARAWIQMLAGMKMIDPYVGARLRARK